MKQPEFDFYDKTSLKSYNLDKTMRYQLDMLDTTKNMEKKLAPYNFFRCNNGYIVNLKHVSQVVGNEVIVGPYHIQISRPRKKGFMEALTNYLGAD